MRWMAKRLDGMKQVIYPIYIIGIPITYYIIYYTILYRILTDALRAVDLVPGHGHEVDLHVVHVNWHLRGRLGLGLGLGSG